MLDPGPIRYPPTRHTLTDLSSINQPGLIVQHLLNGAHPISPPAPLKWSLFLHNYIRTTVAAVVEYESMRIGLDRFITRYWPAPDMPSTVAEIHHLYDAARNAENCVSNFHRALLFLKRIKGSRMVRPLPRSVLILRPYVEESINGFRDAIQHMDERLLTYEALPTFRISTLLTEDRMESFGHQIKYAELGLWLKQAHQIAVMLA